MPKTVQQALPGVEVKTSHCEPEASDAAVKNLHHVPLEMAKADLGAAFEHAIGDEPHKSYGHEGLISGVCSGEKMPDYMARLYLDPEARRRFALKLLKGDPKVTMKTRLIVEIDEG